MLNVITIMDILGLDYAVDSAEWDRLEDYVEERSDDILLELDYIRDNNKGYLVDTRLTEVGYETAVQFAGRTVVTGGTSDRELAENKHVAICFAIEVLGYSLDTPVMCELFE